MEIVPKTRCLRCNHDMKRVGAKRFQLGQTGFFFGTLDNLLSGALEMEIYICAHCGKIEFYSVRPSASEEDNEQNEWETAESEENPIDSEEDEQEIEPEDSDGTGELYSGETSYCPNCGKGIDMNCPICPFCGFQR